MARVRAAELHASHALKENPFTAMTMLAHMPWYVAMGCRAASPTGCTGIIAASGGLVDGTTLQVPTTGYHTMDESASLIACEAFLDVLCRLAQIQPK